MSFSGVSFSIASYAAWAPGMETEEAWIAWAKQITLLPGDIAAPVQSNAAHAATTGGLSW